MSGDTNSRLETRVAVIETHLENIKTEQADNKVKLTDLSVICGDIKHRLDQWNGTLPRLTDTLSNLETHLDTTNEKQHEQDIMMARYDVEAHKVGGLETKLQTYEVAMVEQKTKIRIIWGALTAALSGILGIAIKLVFF